MLVQDILDLAKIKLGNLAISRNDSALIKMIESYNISQIDGDMLLAILKIIVHRRKDFRVIIMSATMEPQKFIDFFTSPLSKDIESFVQVNVITIPGRTYPVTSIIYDSLLFYSSLLSS